MQNLTQLPTGLIALEDGPTENAVLGALLNAEGHELDCREDVIEIIGTAGSAAFLGGSNSEIYDAIIQCLVSDVSTSPHGVISVLRKEGSLTSELMERVHWLAGQADQPVGAVQGARILRDLHRRRIVSRMMDDGARLIRSGEHDADTAIANAFHGVVQAVEVGEAPNTRYERERLVDEGLGVILGTRQREPGLLYGYPDLDERTTGMHPGHMTAIAARSGVGKTVIATNVARHVAMKQDVPVVFFSLEMGPGDLIQRTASAELDIPYRNIRENDLTYNQRERVRKFAEAEYENRNFRVEHVPGATPGEIYLLARKAVREMGAQLFVIDYAQSVQSDRRIDDPGIRMMETVDRTHEMTQKMNRHTLLLAQLKKPQTGREEDAPTNVNDISYGARIENSATTIMLVHRRFEEGKPGAEAEVHVIKARHGSVGVEELTFDGMRQRFLPPGVLMSGAGAL